jgi:GDPmannose 4,6-dehydratase
VTTTVRDFVGMAFKEVGINLDWQGTSGSVEEKGVCRQTGKTIVEVDPRYFRPTEVELLIGDPSKVKNQLGWSPKTSVEELVRIMVAADLKAVKNGYANVR